MTQMRQQWVLNDRGAAGTAVTVPQNISNGVAGWNWFTRGRDEDSSKGKKPAAVSGGGGGDVMTHNSWL